MHIATTADRLKRAHREMTDQELSELLERAMRFERAHRAGGVQANPALDQRLRDRGGAPRALGLSPIQKTALVAYLHTLTDSTFLTAPRFADPFAP